jgi:preprotein translocase subunit YajC
VQGFVIILLFFGAAWFLFVIPRRRASSSHRAMQDSVAVGDDVITAGGLHGKITAIEDDLVKLEIAPNLVVSLDRRAVAAVAREIEIPEIPGEPEEPS